MHGAPASCSPVRCTNLRNRVTLSYRQPAFSRIKERNSNRIVECIRSGKINVIFNSAPVEFRQDSVVLDVSGARQEIANDYVWIFAGGTPPNDFLRKIGVPLGDLDLTGDASHLPEPAVLA